MKDTQISEKFIRFSCLTGCALYSYARYVERHLLTLNQYKLFINNSSSNRKIKIVQFSDVHLGKYMSEKMLFNVVKKINSLSPDMVFFTGDLLDDTNQTPINIKKIAYVLNKIKAPLGKFAVCGNHEYRRKAIREYEKIMSSSGFILLKNSNFDVANTNIRIIGIDDMAEGKKVNGDISKSFFKVKNDKYNIVLCHEPDIIKQILHTNANLMLSGHSHGGQVQIPFLGAVLLPPFAKKYPKGLYKIKENLFLHTSTGIGVTQIPFRFMVPPSISEIELNFK